MLVTGGEGFIGSALLKQRGGVSFDIKSGWDVTNKELLWNNMKKHDTVVHLAANAGVRRSITHPYEYLDNITGFLNVLEGCRKFGCRLIYASSSSVYGEREGEFKEDDRIAPASLYAATKASNEAMADSYVSLYGIKAIGLRFFTVYGPNGRKDMAPDIFMRKIHRGETIDVFNNGEMYRDFTYIDDIVDGISALIDSPAEGIFNIGRGQAVHLMDFIRYLEYHLGKKAVINYLPMQKGDVTRTLASTEKLRLVTGYSPRVSVGEGVGRMCNAYCQSLNGA